MLFVLTVVAIGCRRDTQDPTADEASQLTAAQMQSVQSWVAGAASKQGDTERARRDSVAKLLQWNKHKVLQLKDGRLMLSVPLLGETDGVIATRAIFKLNKKEGTVSSARLARIQTGGNVERALRQYYNHDMKGLSGDVEVTEHTLSNRLATGASYQNGKLRKWGRITEQTATAAGLKMGFDPTPMGTNGDCTHYFYVVSVTYEDGTSYVIGSYYLYSICFDGGGDGGGGGTGGGGEGQVIANEADPRKIHTPEVMQDKCAALDYIMLKSHLGAPDFKDVETVMWITDRGIIVVPNTNNTDIYSNALEGLGTITVGGELYITIPGSDETYRALAFVHTHPKTTGFPGFASDTDCNTYQEMINRGFNVPIYILDDEAGGGIFSVNPTGSNGGCTSNKKADYNNKCSAL